jgi:hypothetical protein
MGLWLILLACAIVVLWVQQNSFHRRLMDLEMKLTLST